MKKLLSFLMVGWLAVAAGYAQTISPYLMGQNAWMPKGYGGAVYNGQLDGLWPLVKKSKVQMVRIGGNGVEFNMPTGPEYVALIDSIRCIGAEPMVQVSEGRGKYTAQQAAATVNYVNKVMGRNVKYWIIGNEPNLAGNHSTVDVAGVAAYTKAWASAMKQVDPSILTVGPECSFYDAAYYPALVGGAHDITGQDANGHYYIDVISFHTYPFGGTQTRAQVLASPQNLAANVDKLRALMSTANALHNRTGSHALQWALTEFNIDYANPAANTVEGVGAHSFLNGQYWAEVFGVGMQKQALSIQPWSVHEGSGARGTGDLGYLDGSGASIKPRSAYYHEMLVAENLRGTYLPATTSQSAVVAFGSTFQDTTSIMLLNRSEAADYDYTLQLSTASVPGTAPLKINLAAGINAAYSDKLNAQSTVVLRFNRQGQLLRKIVYSVQHAAKTLPPTYLKPGQSVALASFTADKTFTCVAPEQVTFTASVLGDFSSLTWNFGPDATPQTATGKGPVAVTYRTAGYKSASLTLQNADTTLTETKTNYVLASACVRTPFAGSPAPVPGVVKAVEFDLGGEGVAYHDSDVDNRGALLNPAVPRATESVDTEAGGEGLGNIGYSASGEWLKYTLNVQRTGLYKVTVRVAASAAGGSLRLLVDDVDKTGVVAVPATGSFNTYQDLVINNVFLEASPNATLKFELVSSSFNFSRLTFADQDLTGIVVNRLYNGTSTIDGSTDAVELLVIKDHLDIRGLIIKDFESNLTTDQGGKYQFRDNALWKDLRQGTTIVLRRLASGISGYTPDVDPADYKLDLLFESPAYLTALSPAGQNFNLTNTDMVVLKTGAAEGVANVVHAFASNNGGGTALFTAVTGPKLVSAAVTGQGAFQYPTNPTQTAADYNGTGALASTDANRNWGQGYGAANVAYINSLRAESFAAPTIVVNRIYNGSNDANGQADAVELLVIKDHLDARNLVIKDFENNITTDNGGKYRLSNVPLWQDLRRGTTIVLRKIAGPAGYVQDTDASDFTLDLLLENTAYLSNAASGAIFNITQYDMVLLKTGVPGGVEGAIHAFATKGGGLNGVPSALYQSVRSAKLTSPDGTDAGGGSFHYPLNPDQLLTDYAGPKGAISKSAALNWGYGFGPGNATYIQALRDSVLAPPTTLTATPDGPNVTLRWTGAAAEETSFEIRRSVDGGQTYTLLATTAAAATSYTDECLAFGTRYTYQVRAKGAGVFSRYSAAASALTGSRPAVKLPALVGSCAVTATPPTAPDACAAPVTATTTDPVAYTEQGTYTIAWTFAYADGSTATVPQRVLVKDSLAPTAVARNLRVTLVDGRATITAAEVNNGSSDDCGIAALALSQTSFSCENLGENPVTLTVTDVHGNAATAAATVTVVGARPALSIQVSRTDQTFTGLPAQTLALGYGAQRLTLTASNATSAGGTTYAWLPTTGLSDPTAANPVFTPMVAGTYTFTATGTNEFGCTATATVTITVLDVRCGNNNEKVLVCHKGNALCVAPSAVAAHLAQHGDQLGSCGTTLAARPEAAPTPSAVFEAYPTPFTDHAVVHFRPATTAPTQVLVYNALGQLVTTLYNAVAEAGRDYEVQLAGAPLPAGIYTCRLLSNGHTETLRLVVVK